MDPLSAPRKERAAKDLLPEAPPRSFATLCFQRWALHGQMPHCPDYRLRADSSLLILVLRSHLRVAEVNRPKPLVARTPDAPTYISLLFRSKLTYSAGDRSSSVITRVTGERLAFEPPQCDK